MITAMEKSDILDVNDTSTTFTGLGGSNTTGC